MSYKSTSPAQGRAHGQAASLGHLREATGVLLLVDDDESTLNWVQEMVAGHDKIHPPRRRFHVIHALTCTSAEQMIDEGRYDVILVDLGLPDVDGIDAFLRVQAGAQGTPVLIWTDNEDQDLEDQAIHAGAQDYLLKREVTPQLLRRHLHHAIERKQLRSDLEKQKRATEISQARLLSMIDSNSDGMLVIDSEGTVQLANPAAGALLGVDPQDLLGAPFGFPISSNLPTELDVLRKDGVQLVLEMRLADFEWEDQTTRIASLRDITLHKKMVAELDEKLETTLTRARTLESIGQLAAGIAHEINTPMQFIGNNIRFVQQSLGHLLELAAGDSMDSGADAKSVLDPDYLQEQLPRALKQSLEGVERVTRIVTAMQAFSRDPGDVMEPADVNRLIESAVTVSASEWKYVADIHMDLDRSLAPVPCLPNELSQVFLNLLVNAAHAIAEANSRGGWRGAITITSRLVGEHVNVTITDTGTGIPASIRDRIFDPFFTTKEVGRGTGQGLALVHAVVVQRHSGTIDFETQERVGTSFTVSLPLNEPRNLRTGT